MATIDGHQETLAEEFARLVDEYLNGEVQTQPEAWNLIADFAVENCVVIRAALASAERARATERSAVD